MKYNTDFANPYKENDHKMTYRESQINEAAFKEYYVGSLGLTVTQGMQQECFANGALWADDNPSEHTILKLLRLRNQCPINTWCDIDDEDDDDFDADKIEDDYDNLLLATERNTFEEDKENLKSRWGNINYTPFM